MGAPEFSILNSRFPLTTPAFLVDRETVRRNCDRMRAKALRSGVAFRPHVKTHKTIEIGLMQHGGVIGPVTVSTLAEAEFFAAAGFRDITYAVPIAPEKLERAAGLASKVERFNILLDNEDTLRAVEEFHRATGTVFDVFLKVDCGSHRAGVDPDSPAGAALAEALAKSPATRLRGLLTHAGHSYDARNVDEIRAVAREESGCLTRFRERLGGAGIGAQGSESAGETHARRLIRSIGSTPTASVVDRFVDCDEVRPGNYVFFDAYQAAIGSCAPGDCAVSVLAAVIGSYPERRTLVVDAGALALSKDAGPKHVDPRIGYGIVCDLDLHPLPLKLVGLSQEHGKIEGEPADISRLPIGAMLRVIPNHSCLTAAMYDVYHVVENGAIVDQWKPVRGW
jgi:D-serine deaminase-like pyridoxal phosphate-dependent protein